MCKKQPITKRCLPYSWRKNAKESKECKQVVVAAVVKQHSSVSVHLVAHCIYNIHTALSTLELTPTPSCRFNFFKALFL